MRTSSVSLRWWGVCLALAGGCQQERVDPVDRQWRAAAEGGGGFLELKPLRGAGSATGPKGLDAPRTAAAGGAGQETYSAEIGSGDEGAMASPFHRYSWNKIRNPDGSTTRLYYFRPGNPGVEVYVTLLEKQVPGFAGLQRDHDYIVKPSFVHDPRQANDAAWFAGALPAGSGLVADLLMVTADADMLERVDAFLSGTISEVPQLEIEVTIIEIAMDDELDYGVKTAVSRGTSSDPEGNLFSSATIDLAQGLVSGGFGAFSAIQDETVVNGLIELFQQTRYSNVLSSPKLAVLNGHRAVIDTGRKIPVFTPAFNASGITGIGTQFKNTGIRVVVVPFILSADTVQLDIAIEVSNLSGFITAGVGSGAEVENPLIARRNAYTVVNVPSGQTVLIGGLVTTDEVDTIDKVPLLGDIPLLGYLFKSKSVERRKAQVLFMVKPKIVIDKFRDGVMYDPSRDE